MTAGDVQVTIQNANGTLVLPTIPLGGFRVKPKQREEQGFTILEMVVVIALIGALSVIFFVVFKTTLVSYLDLQKQATSFGQLSSQADRIANVLRGTTSISSAGDNDLTVYTYFYPSDVYVSQVRYYVVNGATKRLYADLTPIVQTPTWHAANR